MKDRNIERLYYNVTGLRITKNDEYKKIKGDEAEKKVNGIIERSLRGQVLINNIYIEGDFDDRVFMYRTMQIDHVVVSKHAVYVIETKSFPDGATIKGSSFNKEISYVDGNKTKREYNPFRQNMAHVNQIKELLYKNGMDDIEVISIICFAGDNIKIETAHKYNEYLVRDTDLMWMIRHLDEINSGKYVNIKEVKEIIEKNRFSEPDQIPTSIEFKHMIYTKYLKKYYREHKTKRRKRRRNA